MTNCTLTFKSGKPEIINENSENEDLKKLFIQASGIKDTVSLTGNIIGDVLDYTNLLAGFVLSFIPFTKSFEDVLKEYREKRKSSKDEFDKMFEKTTFSKFILLTGTPSGIDTSARLGMFLPVYIFKQAFLSTEENNIKKIFDLGYKYFVFSFAKYAVKQTLPYLLQIMTPIFLFFKTQLEDILGLQIDTKKMQEAFGDFVNQKEGRQLFLKEIIESFSTKEGTTLRKIARLKPSDLNIDMETFKTLYDHMKEKLK